jgi:hypothetical protein
MPAGAADVLNRKSGTVVREGSVTKVPRLLEIEAGPGARRVGG